MGKKRFLQAAGFACFLCLVVIAVLGLFLAASCPAAATPRHVLAHEIPGIRGVFAGGGAWPQGGALKSWEFERFDSDIQVHDNGSFTVRETQVVNFTGSFSFLTRDISTRTASFDEGRTYGKVRVKDIEVFNLDGTPYDSGMWEADSYAGGMLVRIEFQARDEQRGWIISYRMKGAMIYARDYDRLYWNAISLDRDVPIKSSRITVRPPEGTQMDKVKYLDYYTVPFPPGEKDSGRDGDVIWWEAQNIPAYYDFTIDVAFPKGVIHKPWPYRTSTLLLMLGLAFAVFLFALALMLALWAWKGRDAYGGPPPGVSYEAPRELRPAVMAMLVNQQPKMEDISATVVDLAVRGKLKIIEAEEDAAGRERYSFERLDASTKDLLPYERTVMKGLFANKERVDSDDVRMWSSILLIMNGIRKQVKKNKLFFDDPEKTVGRYYKLGVMTILIPPILLFILHFWMDLGYVWLLLAGTVPAGIAIWAIGHAMPQRTPLGSRLYWQTIAFREYLKTAEAGEPESMTLRSFQDNLPYAMILGMTDRWTALFAGVLTTPPDWYSGSGPGFSTTSLTSGLRDMTFMLRTSGAPVSSSSGGSSFGGGFSGGGFGGGSSGGGFGGGGSSAG